MTKDEIRGKYKTAPHNTKRDYEGKYQGGNAVLYARFGHYEDDTFYDTSVEMQRKMAQRGYSDLQITAVYIDCGNKTEKLEELLSDAEKGKFNLVVIPSMIRLRRNIVEVLETIKKLEKSGVSIYFEKENMYICESQNLMLTVLSEFAEEESRMKSEAASRGWSTRRENKKQVLK